MKLKYVIFKIEEYNKEKEIPVIFPKELAHKDVAKGVIITTRGSSWNDINKIEAVSAGFVEITDGKVSCYGKSESLNLSSRETDSEILFNTIYEY